jgi:signal transduction histidine kinase
MSAWPFGRKILAAFLALALLMLGMAAASVLAIRSLSRAHNSLLVAEGRNVLLGSELSRLHERRVSSLRAFLISRDRSHLKTESEAEESFQKTLDELSSSMFIYPQTSSLLGKIESLEGDYSKFVNRALKERSKATWILDSLVKPRRLELERTITELNEQIRGRLVSTNENYERKTLSFMRMIGFMAVGQLLLLMGLGWMLMRIVHEEQQTLTRAKEARDTLQSAEQRAALLAQTGKILTESSDPKSALPKVARLGVDWLSNVCLIELTEGSGALLPVAISISGTEQEPLLRSLHRDLPHGLGSLFLTEQILQTGKPLFTAKVSDPRLSGLGIRTYLAVPLRARNRVLGVLLLFGTGPQGYSGGYYDEVTLQFTQELSHQIALAIDNARLLQQAEEGLRMREELLSTVAHDLKNPLTSIRMNSEMLLKQGSGQPFSAAKMTSIIQESTAEMEKLIHDLLDLTKIESGRIALDRQPHDADELVNDCLKVLGPQAESRGIELYKDVRAGESICDCDRNRVIQVLSNLVGNAIKFTTKGGRIRVEAQATGEGIRFSVIDNGPGIPSEQLPHVFDRYWQARRTGTGSAGLGLSIARGVVEAHGGRIWVESALHIGSRFFFTLPEARKQTKRQAA